MYIVGGLIYVILAIILGMVGGMLPINLSPYAILISALIAGIYVGTKATTPARGAIDGVIAGIIGGIIAGIIAPMLSGVAVMPGSTGFLMLDTLAIMLGTTITSYVTILAGFGFFIGAGIILGAIGGFIGRKIKR